MASLTEQRLKEMEAEMNRFEQEIETRESQGRLAQGDGGPRFIIGANTYNQVQAQLNAGNQGAPLPPGHMAPRPPGPPGPPPGQAPPPPSHPQSAVSVNLPLSVLTAPPPPPPSTEEGSLPRAPFSSSVLPPPPPPPPMFTRPPTGFLPPQLRHRPPGPPPRPPFPPARPPMGMQGPPMMGGPGGMPPPAFPGQPPMYGMPEGGMNPGMPPMAVEQPPPQTIAVPPVTVERPKVVYSAPPVRNVPKSSSQPSATQQQPNGVEAGPTVSGEAALELLGEDTTPVDMEMDMEATPGAEAAAGKREKKEKKKKYIRTAASQTWEDPTLAEWDPDDFRLFCGDLGNEVTDEVLTRAFSKYPSFVKAKVVRDRRTNKTKGYGFASFKDPADFTRAMREMNGKYVGNRPIKLRKSTWKERNLEVVRRKEKEKKRLGLR